MRVFGAVVALSAGLGTAFGQSAPPLGSLDIALASPSVAAVLDRIDSHFETDSALEPRLFELLSLVGAREMSSTYAWSAHERTALEAGLTPAIVDVVRLDRPVAGLSELDALVIDFGRQLYRNRHVESAAFAALLERLGRQGTFDAILALTYPAMTGVLQRASSLPPPEGVDPAALPAMAGVGAPIGEPGVFVALGPRPPLPADVHTESYYRLPLLDRSQLDQRGRGIFDRFVGTDRDTAPLGPVGMTFNSPELVEPIQQLNALLRVEGALDRRMSEIVIAATGREMNSQYQWTVHGAAAEQAGAGAKVLEAIRVDGDLSALDEHDAVAIAFVREIFREQSVRPETLASAVERFGARGTVEIAALIGDYLMVTTLYNALGMRMRPDQSATLPHRAGAPVGAEWR